MIARVYRSQWISACLSLGLLTPVCGAAPPAAAHELQGYYHTVWSSDNGLGGIQDIQQAPDGFLWLTTSTGIFRFDGVRFQSMDEMTNGAVHNQDLEAAFLASDGSAWFNTRNSGLDRWKDNKLVQFSDRRCTPARKYGGIAEDRDGSLWILASAGLFHLSHGTCEQIGSERGLPGGLASAFLMDRKGTLWVKTRTGELLLLPRGEPKFKVSPHGGGAGTSNLYDSYLHEAPDGAVWISDKLGLRRVTDANGAYDLSVGEERRPQSTNGFGDFTFAADGSMWAVNTAGILHFKDLSHLRVDENVDPAEGESVTAAQGLLSSNVVWRLLVDREGTLWVATNAGLDQLRRSAVSTVALPHL
jgi:ligand-binding sensor domain-containing protein